MKLTDVAPLERWIELEREIHARTGMDANVFDIRGYRITPVKNWANRLCPAIKETDKGQSFICAPAHMNIAAQAMRAGEPVVEECDAGMVKLVVPIRLNGEFLGAVGACGMRFEDAEIDAFLVTKMTDIDAETVDSLSATVLPVSREKTEALGRSIAAAVAEILAAVTAAHR
ncbi:MAG: PocR ligand-binding domain-containing protein [Desulfobacterales bacterium]|jgi:ligand-binding sensor protein|nr:PocR ligand-binding domain-containing protein [Desulfobacterales bacterium]